MNAWKALNRPGPWAILAALAVLCLHLYFSLRLSGPWQAPDEEGFLANARLLSAAGSMPNMGRAPFYPFGYSVLLVPAFWVSSNHATVYHAALAINALLWTAHFGVVYALLREAFGISWKQAVAIALVVALFPAYLLHSSINWAENALPLFVALSLFSLHRLLRGGSSGACVSFCFCCAYLYAIHGRGIGAPFIAVAMVALLLFTRRLALLPAVAGASTALLTFLFAKQMESLLVAQGYAGQEGSYGLQMSATLAGAWQLLATAPGEFAWRLVHSWAGPLWYISASTYGVGTIGMVLLSLRTWDLVRARSTGPVSANDYAFVLFAVLLCASIFIVGAGLPSKDSTPLRVDHLFYGRYNESFLFLPLALGLLSFADGLPRRWTRRSTAAAVAITLAAVIVALMGAPLDIWGKENYLPTIFGIGPYFLLPLPPIIVPLAGTFVTIALLLAFWTFRARLGFVAGCLGLFFVLFAAAEYAGFVRRDLGRPTREAAESIRGFIPPGTREIAFDYDNYSYESFYILQFWLDSRFEIFQGSQGETPKQPVVLSQRQPHGSSRYAAYPVAHFDFFLWVPQDGNAAGNTATAAVIARSSAHNAENPPDKLVDQRNTNWRDSWISQPYARGGAAPWAEIVYALPVACTEYTITAANHDPIRYPTSWTVTGVTEQGDVRKLGEAHDEAFGKGQSKAYPCAGGTARFTRFRFDFTGVQAGQDRVAVGELAVK